MSSRTLLSRPRTKVYDANYNIGESYYKGAIDRLDRKYSGRPTSPPKQASSVPRDILERHDKAFADEDLSTARQRAEKLISENNDFDFRSRSERPKSTVFSAETDFDDEVSAALKKFRENNKKVASMMDDVDMESTSNNLSTRRMVKRTEKMLDSVGINESSARNILEDDTFAKRRALRMTSEENGDKHLTKWTALNDSKDTEHSAAAFRAKQSRARLNDLEDEMEALEVRKAARERRAANLRAFVQENAEESQNVQSQMKSARISMRSEKKSVTF